MKRRLGASLIVAVSVGLMVVLTGATAGARTPQHIPQIHHAYRKLTRAQYVLEHSCRHLGGHRVAALRHVEAALSELRLSARKVHASLPVINESGRIANIPGNTHPRIQDAINLCREAKRHLSDAAHDFGGHRVKAIRQIDYALAQLRHAMREPVCK